MKKRIALASSVLAILCQFGRADELADLQAQRVLACERAVELAFRRYQAGADTFSLALEMRGQLVEARLDVAPTREKRIEFLTGLVKTSMEEEGLAERNFKAGRVSGFDLAAAKAARLRVAILLAKNRIDQLPGEHVKNLQGQLVQAWENVVELADSRYRQGSAPFQRVMEARERLVEARLELAPTREKRLEILAELVDVCKNTEQLAERNFEAGGVNESEVAAAKVARLRAAVLLAKGKGGDNLADLQTQRVLACERAIELAFRRYQAGADALSQTLEMQEQLGEARLDVEPTRAQRIAVLTELVEAITDLEKLAERKFKAGQVGELEVVAVKAARLRVAILLAKSELPPPSVESKKQNVAWNADGHAFSSGHHRQ